VGKLVDVKMGVIVDTATGLLEFLGFRVGKNFGGVVGVMDGRLLFLAPYIEVA